MRRVHPDVQSSDPDRQRRASELTARLTRAYETLEAASAGPTGRRTLGGPP
ncbi:MAG: hypothetical protein AABZ30_05340 [Myxococcota bacterium]